MLSLGLNKVTDDYHQYCQPTDSSEMFSLADPVTEESLAKKGFVSPEDVLRLPKITESQYIEQYRIVFMSEF